jgi:hypothetical protein
MGAKLGSAKQARKLARLFEEWRRAFEAQDHVAMRNARRTIDAIASGEKTYRGARVDNCAQSPVGR